MWSFCLVGLGTVAMLFPHAIEGDGNPYFAQIMTKHPHFSVCCPPVTTPRQCTEPTAGRPTAVGSGARAQIAGEIALDGAWGQAK